MRLTPGIVDSTPSVGGGGITFVAQTTNEVTGASSIGVGTPAGVQLDDLLVAICGIAENPVSVSGPTGFSSFCDYRIDGAGNDRLHLDRYKWATEGESGTKIVSWSPDTTNAAMLCMAFRDVNKASGPTDVAMPSHTVNADSTFHKSNVDIGTNPCICPEVTGLTAGSLVIHASMLNGSGVSDISTNKGTATIAYKQITQNPYMLVTYEVVAAGGTYTAGTHTYTDAASGDDWISLTINLKAS